MDDCGLHFHAVPRLWLVLFVLYNILSWLAIDNEVIF